MKDQDKTKAQLMRELAQLRLQHAELKMFQAGYAGPEKSFYPEDGQTQTILDALTEHVVYHDMEMNVLWANRAACQSVDLERERLVGRHCYEIWAQRHAPCGDCPVIFLKKTGQPQSIKKRTPDGRHWHITCAPVFDTNGEMVAVVELTQDISERITMEDALKQSEARHRSLVEASPHGIQEIDPEGTITFANPAHHKIYGFVDSEMIGKSILEMQASGSAKIELKAYLAKLVEEQPNPTPYTAKNYTKDKRVIDVQVDWNYKKDDHGRVTGFISVVTDITEKKRAAEALQQANDKLDQRVQERTAELSATNESLIMEVKERKTVQDALKASQAELNAIFDNMPMVTVIVDQENHVRKANRAAMALTSRLEKERKGRCVGETLGCFHAFDDPNGCGFGPFCKTCKVRLTILETLQSGKPIHEVEATLMFANEKGCQDSTLLVSTAPFSIVGNDMVVVCLQDITKRKQTEDQLNTLNKTLAKRTNLAEQRAAYIQQLSLQLSDTEDRERRNIASIMHDDFQQQLAYIKMELDILRKKAAKKNAQKLGLLAKLTSECIEKSRDLCFEINPPALRRSGLLAALGVLAKDMKRKHGLAVTVRTQPDDEPASLPLASILYRSARELLFNVVKHSGVDSAILDVCSINGMLHIRVEDFGNGFNLGAVRASQVSGAGFGLYSIEDRITFVGGSMKIKTAPGKGCRVVLTVPKDVPRKRPPDRHRHLRSPLNRN